MSAETLKLNDISAEDSEIDHADAVGNEVLKYCLNCGQEVSGNFCSHCGQATSVPERLTNKAFSKSVAMSLARLNPGFFNTFIKLCYKPWEVIRDYIHGRQVGYSHPVSMLIQLTLYTSFIFLMIEGVFGIRIEEMKKVVDSGNWLVRTIKESTVLNVLWISIPLIFALYLAYWRYGSRRFSASEYVIACLYMVISIRIYALVLIPVCNYFFEGDMAALFKATIVIVGLLIISPIAISKAFPIKPLWKASLVFVWFTILATIFLVAFVIAFNLLDDFMITL